MGAVPTSETRKHHDLQSARIKACEWSGLSIKNTATHEKCFGFTQENQKGRAWRVKLNCVPKESGRIFTEHKSISHWQKGDSQ